MCALDDDKLKTGFTQKTFREWQQANRGYKGISVVCHPLKRVFHAFCERILFESEKSFPRFRKKLAKDCDLKLPKSVQVIDIPVDDLRHLFSGFSTGEPTRSNTLVRRWKLVHSASDNQHDGANCAA